METGLIGQLGVPVLYLVEEEIKQQLERALILHLQMVGKTAVLQILTSQIRLATAKHAQLVISSFKNGYHLPITKSIELSPDF